MNIVVAYLPGQSSMEISMTSGQFNSELFLMANAVEDFTHTSTYDTFFSQTVSGTNTANQTITLAHTPKADTLYIAGLTNGTDYSVSGSTLTLVTAQTGEIEVSYEATVSADMIEVDNQSAAVGEAILKWPVYSDGNDCTKSSIKGYLIMRVYRCRVTQMPGFDSSYKSAGTNAVTFSAMDPKRDDEKIYNMAFVPKESTESTGT